MKVLNKVLIGLTTVFMLTACASKTDYATFHSKAGEAYEKAKEVSFSKVVVSGWEKNDKGEKEEYDNVTVKFEKGTYSTIGGLLDSTAKEIALAAMLNFTFASVMPEDEDATYYAGSSFKVEGKDSDGNKAVETWNQYGLLTSMKSADGQLKVSYKK